MSRIMDNRLRAILTGSRSHPMASNSPHIPNKRTSSWEEILRPAIGSRHNTKEQSADSSCSSRRRSNNKEHSYKHPGRPIIMCIPCCLCVSTSEVVIVERLGKFDRMLPAGLGIVCCPCEQTAGSVSFRKCLRQFWTMSYSMKLDACIANLLPPPTSPPFPEY